MSAASLPKPEPEPGPDPSQGDADGWALLVSLRRRLDEQAAQGRKTQQQVTQLAESIGALVDVQRRRARSLNLNSFVAYLIFTMLLGAGFYLLYRSRVSDLAVVQHERDLAVRRADESTTKATARELADIRAWEVYELLEAGKRSEATAKLEVLRELPLSRTERAVLAARALQTQIMEVESALKAAAAAFKAGRHADVIAPLEAALVSEPTGTRAASIRYYLGVAYAKLGQLDKAITHLTPALASEAQHDDVRFQLASALDRSGAYAKARVEYDRFATAHPQSPFAVFAMRRSATLSRMPAVAPAAASPPIAPPIAPGAAAPVTPGPAAAPVTPGPAAALVTPIAPGAAAPVTPGAPQPAAAAPVKPAPRRWVPARKPVPMKPKPPAPTTLDFNEPEPVEPVPAPTAPASSM